MKYEQAVGQIKSGDLIALTHTKWRNLYDLQVQAVRLFTQSEYSHIAVAWVSEGRVFLIESVTPKIRIMPLENIKDGGFYWIPTTTPMSDTELAFGLSWVGLGEYSKFQAIGGHLESLKVGEDNKWQCAELTITMRRLSGLDLGPKATPHAVVKQAMSMGLPNYYVST